MDFFLCTGLTNKVTNCSSPRTTITSIVPHSLRPAELLTAQPIVAVQSLDTMHVYVAPSELQFQLSPAVTKFCQWYSYSGGLPSFPMIHVYVVISYSPVVASPITEMLLGISERQNSACSRHGLNQNYIQPDFYLHKSKYYTGIGFSTDKQCLGVLYEKHV